jgi:hypothetical protein
MIKQLLMVVVAMVLVGGTEKLQAQAANADGRKFEVGGQLSMVRLGAEKILAGTTVECFVPPCPLNPVTLRFGITRHMEYGFGGRFGYRLGDYITVEAEANFFPRDRVFEQGRKLEGLFGVKVGKRTRRVGFFGKARPGFLYASRGDYEGNPLVGCPAVFPPPLGCFQPVGRTSFALDLGGVLEIYPTRRTIVRFDAGDTMVRFGDRRVAATPDSSLPILTFPTAVLRPAETTHNLQFGVGFGFRF